MEKKHVNIDFDIMGRAMRKHVRKKAALASSTIIYMQDGNLIEEDPKNAQKTVLKKVLYSSN